MYGELAWLPENNAGSGRDQGLEGWVTLQRAPVIPYICTECATQDMSLSFSLLASLSPHPLLSGDKIASFSTLAGSGKIRYCPPSPYTKVLALS